MKKLSPMRQQILNFITQSTEENGYPPTVREICDAVGLRSPSTVHSHLKILQESGYLAKDERKTRAISVSGSKRAVHKAFHAVPLLGTVTAGVPILAQEELLGTVPYDGADGADYFALTVRGDSMINAAILDGDIVIVRQQNSAIHGQIIVALLEDEATVKRLHMSKDGVWLMPENPAYSPINGRYASILGLVVAVYRTKI